ncbi:hypothetical protein C5Y93_00010 [Blastopirellula marina]|uniref:Squalene cyclase C-terminal domain-containing protein n=2 Tax=Blastopirellula marina TaxID=124 RepID=A0A2S8GUP4_9BACT|nr:hypothetical protein C5Y93_00010 [Blastopirellula marina]
MLLPLVLAAVLLLPGGRTMAEEAATHQQQQAATLLKIARETLAAEAPEVKRPAEDLPRPSVVFLSLTRTAQAAVIGIGVADTLEDATRLAAQDLRDEATFGDLATGRLRIDFVHQAKLPQPAGEPRPLKVLPSPVGLMFVRGDWLFVPEDTNLAVAQSPAVSFASWIETPDGLLQLYEGSPLVSDTSPAHLLAACTAGGDYLLRGLLLDGKFDYLYDAATNESVDDYNLVRHAGACGALAEIQLAVNQEATRQGRAVPQSQPYLEGSRRGLDYLLRNYASGPYQDNPNQDFTTIISNGQVSELGATALTLLAMTKCHNVSADSADLDLMRQLGKFILHQQQPDGRFLPYYYFLDHDGEQPESQYYPGEAILALTRLARIDPSGPWLAAAQKGADYLIDIRDAGIPMDELYHDHWLLISLNQLTDLTDNPRYIAHAEKLGTSICNLQVRQSERLDWIGTYYQPPRSNPTACRGEALVAMIELARREKLDDRRYLETMARTAALQLRFQITANSGIYLPRPDLATGGFRGTYSDWNIQIDTVQHNVSSLLGYRALQLGKKK